MPTKVKPFFYLVTPAPCGLQQAFHEQYKERKLYPQQVKLKPEIKSYQTTNKVVPQQGLTKKNLKIQVES
jgi:hypothetical protein